MLGSVYEFIKYINLIEISPVLIVIRGVENGNVTVAVNDRLLYNASFLATETRPCVLMKTSIYDNIMK